MIWFYRTKDCRGCQVIEETLREMSAGFAVKIVGPRDEAMGDLPVEAPPPVLVDGKTVIQGFENIIRHLEELEGFLKEWRKFQSDACYCGEETTGPEGEAPRGASKGV